jgi:ATP-dependent helicase Lhr and Lhr-like helicase
MLENFHPAVARWFSTQFAAPTAPQLAAWPAIASGQHALIAAPTGSGKTLAAFLAAIDRLVREAVAGDLPDGTQIVYVSPLKALSNDIQRNLELPLAGIQQQLQAMGLPEVAIRTQVRTGDTPASERAAMRRSAPHILVTTPESLYLLVTSESGRRMLSSVRSVIVDEVHAVASSKRGAHLALTLERLSELCARPVQRIGLSATQKPIALVADFLTGGQPCVIIDSGHARQRDLALLLPDAPLEAVMSNDVWEHLYDRLAQLIHEHRTTLVFANTRRMVERVTRHLSERIGEQYVAAHHGSLAKEQRLDAEQRLKSGQLRALVATASLELGIDIGDVELVVQLGTPHSISAFLQRVGRANHAVGGVPRGRIVPLSRDELIECSALLNAVRAGELDALTLPAQPLDVLSQQLVAEVSAREWGEEELFKLVRRAWTYRHLTRADFDAVVHMLADGVATRRGRQSAYLHRDAVNGVLRARRGARLTAITCGGAIPDNADYQVVLEPGGTFIGTLNEDFAVESLAGDVFQLGNHSYRILRVEAGRIRVEDARGQPPTMPFWLGEAPARTSELSATVAALRAEVDEAVSEFDAASLERCAEDLARRHELPLEAARQIVDYLAASKALLGILPTRERLVFERFFDEAGDMHLVIHAPLGSRINRALGLTLRKRFCRAFNFELQAAANEDAIVLSLGETHSFALDQLPRFLNSASAARVLTAAVLDAPLFATRWRWNATIALAIKRFRHGKKTPAPLQRMAAEDLISVIFPDQLACAENLTGEREIPDHPLVRQTLHDCLHEAMDLDGLEALLKGIEAGTVQVHTRDLPQASPLAAEILSARPYTYLDDAPLEERRTQAVAQRRWLDPQIAAEFGRLDPAAIDAVRAEAWPLPESADELHDALMLLGAIGESEGRAAGLREYFETLREQQRATRLYLAAQPDPLWVCAEALPMLQALYRDAVATPPLKVPAEYASRDWDAELALKELLRGRLQAVGPTTAAALAQVLMVPESRVEAGLVALETEGFVLRGQFTPQAQGIEWCERRLLARIHRYTLKALRDAIEPVTSGDFMRFLLEWQGVTRSPRPEGAASLEAALEQLEGFEAPAAAWESDLLPARLHNYEPAWLDSLCLAGRTYWARLESPQSATAGPVRATPIALLMRRHRMLWQQLSTIAGPSPQLSSSAQMLAGYLELHGASFFDEMQQGSGLLQAQAESALAELVAAGTVTSDSFGGLRALLTPLERRRKLARGRPATALGLTESGRWSLVRRDGVAADAGISSEAAEQIAVLLLRRYGVVFRRLLSREATWLPPWFQLLRAYRRLEAQGHIRGGRFVAGVSGEQYALPDAVAALRAVRKRAPDGAYVSLSAADPLNLLGILTPGARVAALAGNRLLLRDGIAVATYTGGEVQWLQPLAPHEQWQARTALLRRPPHRRHAQVG